MSMQKILDDIFGEMMVCLPTCDKDLIKQAITKALNETVIEEAVKVDQYDVFNKIYNLARQKQIELINKFIDN